MIKKKVTRYYAECGKGFWKKSTALTHELNCKCWKNPKNKTCLTCKKAEHVVDHGDEITPGEGAWFDCSDSRVGDHENDLGLSYLSVGCKFWEES